MAVSVSPYVSPFLVGRVVGPLQYWADEWADEDMLELMKSFFGELQEYVRARGEETWEVWAQSAKQGKLPFERKYKFIQTYGSELFSVAGGVQAAAFLCETPSYTIDKMRRLLTVMSLGVEKRRGNYGTTLRSDFTDSNYLNRKEKPLMNAHIVRGFGKKVSDGKKEYEVDLSKPVPAPTQYRAAFQSRPAPEMVRPKRQYSTKAPYALAISKEGPSSMSASSYTKYTRDQILQGLPEQASRFATSASLGRCIGQKVEEPPEEIKHLSNTLRQQGTLNQLKEREELERPPSEDSMEAPSRLSSNTYLQEKPKYFETLRKQAERDERRAARQPEVMREGSVAARSYRRADPVLVQKMRPKPFRPEAGKIPFDTQAVLDRYTTDHKANYHEDNSIKTTLNL